MAHKTFISYKYSESQDLRDRIIDALGEDAAYYKGETSDSITLYLSQSYEPLTLEITPTTPFV